LLHGKSGFFSKRKNGILPVFRLENRSMKRRNPPSYRLHQPSGQAVVTLNGHDIYLGVFDSPESHAEYDRLIAEWLSAGRQLPSRALSINELLLAYVRFAADYYTPPSTELDHVKLSIRPLKALYGRSDAKDFGPLSLKAVRDKMVEADLCRREVNKRIVRIKRLFGWAVENELVPPSVHHGLQAVKGLRAGRSKAGESKPVRPVPAPFIDAVRPFVLPEVWAMIELQRFTGMRPGEVCIMRSCDLDTSSLVWLYRPARHKTQHHGHERVIAIGPHAQEVLRPWLRVDLEAPLFNPREAIEKYQIQRGLQRKTKVQPSQRNRRKKNPKRRPRECYDVRAFYHAVKRACEKANVPHWHPHQLRHNAATWLRKEFGLDVARVVLGHRSPQITELYADLDTSRAIDAMASFG
jgi:integrase